MAGEKDYTKYSFRITILVIVLMLGLTLVPPFSIGSIRFKRTNILSDIIKFDDRQTDTGFDDTADRHFIEEMERREQEQRMADSLAALAAEAQAQKPAEPREQSWNLGSEATETAHLLSEQPIINGEKVVRIEDFSQGEGVSIADFCRLLGTATQERTVRVAFLGDSYIEGDILTADVREQLQTLYSGSGIGFVPFSTPLATNRPTIKHSFGGWENYNVAQKKSAPEELNDKFFVSGTLSVPVDGVATWAEYQSSSYRKHLSQSSGIRLIFENPGASVIKLTVNDSIERRFTPDTGDAVQQIRAGGIAIKKVRVEIEQPEGFIGYGVVFEGNRGVAVDNYSIRSNSGLALFGTSAKVNSQIDKMLGYDLIVLQYGLNAMSADVVNYAGYGENMERAVNYMKRCFPHAAILMMGVGDRSTTEGGDTVTMAAVPAMIKEQRAIARECKVAFWDTYAAMGGMNSMPGFVEKGWAAKDYTHLSFGGGRHLAKQLVNALLYVKQVVDQEDLDADTEDAAQPEYPVGEADIASARPAATAAQHDLMAPVAQEATTTPAEEPAPETHDIAMPAQSMEDTSAKPETPKYGEQEPISPEEEPVAVESAEAEDDDA